MQYTLATRMIRILKLIVVLIIGYIIYKTIAIAKGQASGLGTWFHPILQVVIFVPIIYFVAKILKSNKKSASSRID